MSKTISISTWVEIYLDEVDTEDLIDELKSRNVNSDNSDSDDLMEMFYAFKLGKTDRAMERAKKIACDHTGQIL